MDLEPERERTMLEIEDEWAELAERRWREIEAGEVETVPWEVVRAKLFRRG
jgi:putative addiction module component (TIGR02574 family)